MAAACVPPGTSTSGSDGDGGSSSTVAGDIMEFTESINQSQKKATTSEHTDQIEVIEMRTENLTGTTEKRVSERRSGKIPARKRNVPFKFRDYRNPEMLNENGEQDDADYEPETEFQTAKKKISTITPARRGRGRPRKSTTPGTLTPIAPLNDSAGSSIQIQDMNIVIIQAIGDAQNAILQTGGVQILPAPSVSGDQTPGSLTLSQGPSDKGKVLPIVQPEVSVTPESAESSSEPQNAEKKNADVPQRNKYECKFCMRLFSSKGNLKTHVRGHLGEKPFHCDIDGCNKSFRSNEGLRRHKMSHLGIKPFQCEICQGNFSSNVSLQEHMARHTDTKPHQCHVCLRNFRQISCLRRHLVTHSSEMPFQCNICNRRFSQNMYLRSHMKMHTGERPFKCQECGKAFAHQSDLIRHKIIHTGEKPFVCEVCHSRFSDPSSKRRHEREHVGTKPYTCQLCFESFKRAGQLKAHLSRKHTNQKDDIQVVRTSTGTLQFAFKDGMGQYVYNTEKSNDAVASDSTAQSETSLHKQPEKQKKIVKLIKDLNTSIVHQYQINLPPHDYLASDDDKNLSSQDDLVSVESVVMETLQDQSKSDPGIHELPDVTQVQNLPISTYQNGDSQVITIAEVMEDEQSKDSSVPVEYLQIIEELVPDSLEQQIVEVHYQDSTNTVASVTEDVISAMDISTQDDVTSDDTMETQTQKPSGAESSDELLKNTNASASEVDTESSNIDYVLNPDFGSQQYYNWLSSFTELSKVMPMPLDVSLFQKISQVHKTLSDVMATPSGVIADKENFKILMNISKELNTIINEHLFYVMQNLDKGEGEDVN